MTVTWSEFSKSVQLRALSPQFILSFDEEQKLIQKRDFFHLKFEVKNSNGLINIYGIIKKRDSSAPVSISQLYFSTNITGPSLAFLDATIELCHNKNSKTLGYLTIREIENFLRDDNITPSYPNDALSMFRIFECIYSLQEKLIALYPIEKNSPTMDDLAFDQKPIYSVDENGPFENLNFDQKMDIIDEVLKRYVSPSLKKDGGDVECVHIMDSLVVVNYLGACSTCSSSADTTLNFVQSILQREVQTPALRVITDS